eukprot:1367684-Amphidinium_carterae.1
MMVLGTVTWTFTLMSLLLIGIARSLVPTLYRVPSLLTLQVLCSGSHCGLYHVCARHPAEVKICGAKFSYKLTKQVGLRAAECTCTPPNNTGCQIYLGPIVKHGS